MWICWILAQFFASLVFLIAKQYHLKVQARTESVNTMCGPLHYIIIL